MTTLFNSDEAEKDYAEECRKRESGTTLEENKYIEKYCDNKYAVYLERIASGAIQPLGMITTEFHDIKRYRDTVRNIEVESRYYIGD